MRVVLDKKSLKIDSVTPGSPVDKAGLKANDVIIKIDNQTLEAPEDLGTFLKKHRPGAKVNVVVQRGNETMTIVVVIGKRAQ